MNLQSSLHDPRHDGQLRRGFTRIELVIVLVCIVIVLVIAALMLRQTGGRGNVNHRQMKDATQLGGIAQSLGVLSREFNNVLPSPSIIARKPVAIGGELRYVSGRGEIEVTLDTTANLYSMLIAQNYATPDLLISPLERNPRVIQMARYNWDEYDPKNGVFWDSAFQADLDVESNVSYAHLLLWGERKTQLWRDSRNAGVGIISSRGPAGGVETPTSFTCDAQGNWRGHIIAGDGSINWHTSLTGWEHLFRIDEGLEGADPVLTFTREIDADTGPTIQHD